jgi:hypothetical protein
VLHDLHAPAATDGTSEAHRHAYNAAFHALDLNWQWDPATFADVQRYGRAGVQSWIEIEQPHLLKAYAAGFLVDAIESTKARCLGAYEREASTQSAGCANRLAA